MNKRDLVHVIAIVLKTVVTHLFSCVHLDIMFTIKTCFQRGVDLMNIKNLQ